MQGVLIKFLGAFIYHVAGPKRLLGGSTLIHFYTDDGCFRTRSQYHYKFVERYPVMAYLNLFENVSEMLKNTF